MEKYSLDNKLKNFHLEDKAMFSGIGAGVILEQ
jgi:hypothetical protein